MDDAPGGRILVAVDGSDSSKDALRTGARLAEALGAPLDAVLCWELPPFFEGFRDDEQQLRNRSARLLETTLEEVFGEPAVEWDRFAHATLIAETATSLYTCRLRGPADRHPAGRGERGRPDARRGPPRPRRDHGDVHGLRELRARLARSLPRARGPRLTAPGAGRDQPRGEGRRAVSGASGSLPTVPRTRASAAMTW